MSVERLCTLDPERCNFILQNPHIHERLRFEAAYSVVQKEQYVAIEEVRKDEVLRIPAAFDFFNPKLAITDEEREKLSLAQPQTVR